jgi:hypothetical protein
VNTPGVVTITGYYIQGSYTLPLKSETVRVVGKVQPIGAEVLINWNCELTRTLHERKDHVGVWGFGPFNSF